MNAEIRTLTTSKAGVEPNGRVMAVTLHGAGSAHKRSFDQTTNSNVTSPVLPLAKRQKSQTPAVADGPERRLGFSRSHPPSKNAKPVRPATPPASASARDHANGPTTSTPKRSPWKARSRYSLSNEKVRDLGNGSPIAHNTAGQEPQTTSLPTRTGVRPESRASSTFGQMKSSILSAENMSSSSKHRFSPVQSRRHDTDWSKRTSSSRPGEFVKSEKHERTAATIPRKVMNPGHDRASHSSPSEKFRIDIPRPISGSRTATSQPDHNHGAKIQVVIEDQRKTLLKEFQGPLPKSKAQIQVEKNKVFAQLQQSTTLARENPELVEKLFGTTGFSAVFKVDDHVKFMRDAASKKKKKVKRSNIGLEMEPLSKSLDQLSLSKSLIHPARAARDILTSRFDESLGPPLTFSNDINDKRLAGKFQFIDHYIIGSKVKVAPPSTNSGCDCTNCALSTCTCMTKEVEGRATQVEIYVRRPDGIVVLSDEHIASVLGNNGADRHEITECNEHCGCGDDCWNRVVCKGRTVPLEVFQTEKCGWGVRSSKDIVKGQFIERYLGEVITTAELELREDAVEEHQPSYAYSLDWFNDAGNKEPYQVDGVDFGSAMRFVNHSCNPNARSFPVQTHRKDKRVYDLAFFAIKDIKAGEEIRISYLNDAEPDDDEHTISEDLVKCQCGEDNCRGILWRPGVKTRRRRRRKE
ncbi:hypothetical protein AYO20_01754 [Fonsecaea nubica]|uniref:SET domain-containing protein n=1 Tax=Fonsecaea nubica TaxID=856822 RepID=A0A178DCN4_9EURO|nr:hypothetical protein AYO20_01754 [Fonsecaea nubica]OAL39003.1 hypothetical protein AYO20_01754 [Fonsecaea nubica]